MEINEILSKDELINLNYYHCFSNKSGHHSIQQFNGSSFTGGYHNLSTDKMMSICKVIPVDIPQLTTIGLCNTHHGIGFQSDCAICNE